MSSSLIESVAPRIMLPPYRLNPNAPLNQGLVAKYICLPGMTGGRLWYDLVKGNNGTLTNMTSGYGWTGAIGRPGGWGAMRFDGSNDYVSMLAPKPTIALTYSIWCRVTSTATLMQLLRGADNSGSGANYGYTLSPSGLTSGKYAFAVKTAGDNIIEATIPDTQWNHVVATYNGTTQSIYVNGRFVSSKATTGAVVYGSSNTLVGIANSATSLLPFSGWADDFSLYSRAFSATEVAGLYEASKNQYRNEILCAWET